MKNLIILLLCLMSLSCIGQTDYDKIANEADSMFWASYEGPDPLAFDEEEKEIFELINRPSPLLQKMIALEKKQYRMMNIDWSPVIFLGVLVLGAGVALGAIIF